MRTWLSLRNGQLKTGDMSTPAARNRFKKTCSGKRFRSNGGSSPKSKASAFVQSQSQQHRSLFQDGTWSNAL
jgi:hypothetical protein